MIRLIAVTAALGLLTICSLGCRSAHLGPNTGDTYRAALNAQAEAGEGDEDEVSGLSAEDAKRTMRVHETGEEKSSGGSSGAIPGMSNMPGSSDTSTAGGGKWPGAQGNIKLEAK